MVARGVTESNSNLNAVEIRQFPHMQICQKQFVGEFKFILRRQL